MPAAMNKSHSQSSSYLLLPSVLGKREQLAFLSRLCKAENKKVNLRMNFSTQEYKDVLIPNRRVESGRVKWSRSLSPFISNIVYQCYY